MRRLKRAAFAAGLAIMLFSYPAASAEAKGLRQVKEDGSMGELVGLFEFQDIGAGMDTDGDGKGDYIINGQSLDVWVGSLSDAYEWRDKYGDYIYMKIIKSDG